MVYYQAAQKNFVARAFGYCLMLLMLAMPIAAAEPAAMMLATVYQPHADVARFWVSEKLDGVRARWDGKQLISRGGNVFMAPAWFVQGFPAQPLDGELWMGRGHYEDVVAVVRKQAPHDGWKGVKFMVFDMPALGGIFTDRVKAMQGLPRTPYLDVIGQFRVDSQKALADRLDAVVKQGGEGLMLHHQDALYQAGRSTDVQKLKPFDDAEATVIGYKPGKGKNTGLMGSVKVRMENGKTFYIGTGFTDQQRKTPPPLGSLLTYRYQGYTQAGLPRFAVFVRQRNE
ncbi:MAG: DNA ligase [Methylococcales bacterium]|nr:DNA ligase [Methylococcales bacterium]